MDGFKDKVAIFPISLNYESSYKGIEYLGIYPYIERETMRGISREYLWVTDQENNKIYSEFNAWLNGSQLIYHNS